MYELQYVCWLVKSVHSCVEIQLQLNDKAFETWSSRSYSAAEHMSLSPVHCCVCEAKTIAMTVNM